MTGGRAPRVGVSGFAYLSKGFHGRSAQPRVLSWDALTLEIKRSGIQAAVHCDTTPVNSTHIPSVHCI